MATSKITSKADFVVEQGTSGIWTYRKWNSGIAECWGSTTVTANSSGKSSVNQALPTFFITDRPIVSVFGTQAGNDASYMAAQQVGGSSGAYTIICTFPGWAGATSRVHMRAIGIWK